MMNQNINKIIKAQTLIIINYLKNFTNKSLTKTKRMFEDYEKETQIINTIKPTCFICI